MVGDVNEAGRIPCVNPGAPEPKAWAPDPWMLTPRPDIPRAWPPGGVPIAAEYEYAVQYKTPNGWEYTYESWDCRWQESEAVQEVRAYRDNPDEETPHRPPPCFPSRGDGAMSKWKVRRENTIFFHPDEDDVCYGPRWCITSPTGVSWGNKDTFAEAIAYADKRARTRTYVLPRSNSTPKRAGYQWHIKEVESGALLTRAKRTNDGYRMTQKLHIGRKDLVEVAMLLLAHAERIGE